MTRLLNADAITVKVDGEQNPLAFTLEGRTRAIEHVHQHWLVDTEWWSEAGHVHREYYAVTTSDGLLCTLYRDFVEEQWCIEKVYD
jgi:hypothetical protein